jgi:hypothetical protein
MDLHVRSVSPTNRSVATGRSQPIRLQPARALAPAATPAEAAPAFQPINRSKSGPFAYEQGSFVLAGQTEVDADGAPQVRGTARFQLGNLSLASEGRFVLGYEGAETALIGEGDFVWRDGRGTPVTGKGTIAVRQDPQGNAIVQLDGMIETRHQTIDIAGPAQAEIDARADGAFVVRLKGQARFGTPLATIDGELDLTYGEVDGERLNAVTIQGRAQSQGDACEAGGEGQLTRRWQYGRTATVLTIAGPGTYRHGNLVCRGQIVLRIVPHGQGEAYDGTVLGEGHYRDEGLTAVGRLNGSFFQHGDRHDFDGRLDGDLWLETGPARSEDTGRLELTLRRDSRAWRAQTPTAGWTRTGWQGALTDARWQRREDETTALQASGRLAARQALWWLVLDGTIGLTDGADGWAVTGSGDLAAGLVGGLTLGGPGQFTLDAKTCLASGKLAGAANLAGTTVVAGAPVTVEAGPLPDGRTFCHLRLGGAHRPLTLSAGGDAVRIRQADPGRPIDRRLALSALPAPPEPAHGESEAQPDPDRPQPHGHP